MPPVFMLPCYISSGGSSPEELFIRTGIPIPKQDTGMIPMITLRNSFFPGGPYPFLEKDIIEIDHREKDKKGDPGHAQDL